MKWFKQLFEEKDVTVADLQAELKALCNRLIIMPDSDGFMRYEKLLKEIYKRGEKPEIILVLKKNK